MDPPRKTSSHKSSFKSTDKDLDAIKNATSKFMNLRLKSMTRSTTPSSPSRRSLPHITQKREGKSHRSQNSKETLSELALSILPKHTKTPELKSDTIEGKKAASIFLVLPQKLSNELLGMKVEKIEERLKSVLNLDHGADLKDASILDYYVAAVYWSQQQGHSTLQLSTFFYIVHKLLTRIREENLSKVEAFIYFRSLLAGKSEECVGQFFFNTDQAKAVTKYLHTSLFQHFKLYELMFSTQKGQPIINLTAETLSVEVPHHAQKTFFSHPIDEAIPENIYKNFLTTTPQCISQAELPPSEKKRGKQNTQTRNTGDTSTRVSRAQSIHSHKSSRTSAASLPLSATPRTPKSKSVSKHDQGTSISIIDSDEFHKDRLEHLVSKLTPQDVKTVVTEVAEELVASLRQNVQSKMRKSGSQLITRINKIHVLAEKDKEK